MPSMHGFGFDFVTIPYDFGDGDIGYIGRVLSVVNSTTISVPAMGYEAVHDAGSFYDFEYHQSRHGTTIHCSQPCIAVQYAKESETVDSTPWILPFMLVLTPLGHYSRNATFSSPSWAASSTQVALSVLVDFFPVDDLYMDGINMEFLEWNIIPDGTGAYATVTVETGQHNLYTTDPEHG